MNGPATTSQATRVAVIGGGWAGMAAAVELALAGVPVTVYEAAKTLGGRARRVDVNGIVLDNGLHILIGAYRETLRLIETVRDRASPSRLLRLPLQLRIEPDFRFAAMRLPAPFHLAFGLLFARGVSGSERLAAARFILAQRRARYRCDEMLSVRELLERFRQPRRLRERLWEPLCVSALNTDPDEASAQVFLTVLRDTLDAPAAASDLLLPATDFTAIFPAPAQAFIESRSGQVRIGEPVTRIRSRADGIEVEAADRIRYSHAIIAVGPHRLEHVATDIAELQSAVEQVRALEFQPIYSVFLQYPDSVSLAWPMIGFTGGLAQWVFDRGRLCGQRGMLGVVISAAGAHQDLPHNELASRVHTELTAALRLPPPLWHQVIAEKRATFACKPGIVRPGNRTPVKGLYLAGDYTASDYPATLEAAVRSGITCARLILRDA
ncbi:MAG: hydroxysqualene dehydroxylase HpnE [Burkholderiales bacterium]